MPRWRNVITCRLFHLCCLISTEPQTSFWLGSRGDETSLPQDPDADTEGRKKELQEQRNNYEWRFEVR